MQPHGDIQLELQGNILIIIPKGPFNIEGAIIAVAKYKDSIEQKNLTKWYRLDIWDEDSMGTPEALEHSIEVFNWSQRHGCMATAIVVSNTIQSGIARKIIPQPMAVCYDKSVALNWLEEQRASEG